LYIGYTEQTVSHIIYCLRAHYVVKFLSTLYENLPQDEPNWKMLHWAPAYWLRISTWMFAWCRSIIVKIIMHWALPSIVRPSSEKEKFYRLVT